MVDRAWEVWWVTAKGCRVSFRGDENVLKLIVVNIVIYKI